MIMEAGIIYGGDWNPRPNPEEATMQTVEKIVIPTYDEHKAVFINKRVNDIMLLIRAELTKDDPTDVFDAKSSRPTIRLDIPYDIEKTPAVKVALAGILANYGWMFNVDEINGTCNMWYLRMYMDLSE